MDFQHAWADECGMSMKIASLGLSFMLKYEKTESTLDKGPLWMSQSSTILLSSHGAEFELIYFLISAEAPFLSLPLQKRLPFSLLIWKPSGLGRCT